MSPATTTGRRWRPVIGVVLGLVLALGTALVASGASREVPAATARTATQSQSGDCSSILVIIAHAVSATSRTGNPSALTAARNQAVLLARTTASADVRESVQNLADDLAAYRTTLTVPSTQSPQRHTDIGATIHGDLKALRKLCGQ
jgi:hypothetical protein